MKKRILIVEDDSMNMKLIRDILHISGYDTLDATDGQSGVDIALREKPDLILMDIQLPVMDGIEATRIIKSHRSTRRIPILALTGYGIEGDMAYLQQAGFSGVIPKPFHIRNMLNILKNRLSKQENSHDPDSDHSDR